MAGWCVVTSPDLPVGACGDAAPTGDPVTRTRRILSTDQYLYDSHAHLELVVLAYMTGRHLDSTLAAAKAHLDHYKDRP